VKRYPLVAPTLLFIAGLTAANWIALPWGALLIASWALLILGLLPTRFRSALLCLLFLLLGAAALSLRTSITSPQDIRRAAGAHPRIAIIRGELTETPYHRIYERRQHESYRTIAFLSLNSISFSDQTNVPVVGLLAINTTGILPASFYEGQRVEVSGVIETPPGPGAEGLFDYATYLKRQGIHYQFQVASSNDWRLMEPLRPRPLADRFTDWAQSALALGLPEIDEPVRLLWAMTLGWKTGLAGDVSEPFMRSGTMHVFAISGLHIAFIAAIAVMLLRCFGVPRNVCAAVVIPLIWAYTGLTGWQASAIRSTIMTSIIVAGWCLRRPSELLNSLAAAALIILIWDPQQLFQPGFQLSFGVVLSLALISPVLTKWKDALLKPDPMLPDELRSRTDRWGRATINFGLTALTTSLAAWLGSIPVVAYYFHFLTPSSLVANLAVVPLSSMALASNLASLLFAGWFPACAELLNHAAWAFMSWMVRISEICADMPLGCFNISAPGLLTFALYYMVLVSVMAGWLWSPRFRYAALLLVAILGAGWVLQWNSQKKEAYISLLPLKGGEAIYIEEPGSHRRTLIDGGDETSAKVTTKSFLRAQGVNHLSGLVLTHGDVHQNGGAQLLQQTFPAEHVYASPLKFRSPPYRRTIDHFRSIPGLVQWIKRGDRIGRWQVLHPEANDRYQQADDVPLVLLGTINGVTLLLVGDLTQSGQNKLLSHYPNLRADIVVSGIPQRSEPVVDGFLEVVKPRTVIITDDVYPGNERANRALRERLHNRDFAVWYTSDAGALTIRLRNGTWNIEAADPRHTLTSGPDQAEPAEPTQTEPEE